MVRLELLSFIGRFSNINFSLPYMRKIERSSQIKDIFRNYDSSQTQVVGEWL